MDNKTNTQETKCYQHTHSNFVFVSLVAAEHHLNQACYVYWC